MSESISPRYAHFQAGAALLSRALAGEAPRIPVFAQMHEFAAAHLGIPRREFFARPEILVPAILEVQSRFGLDVASVTYDVYNIEAEALGQPIHRPDDGMPDIDRSAPLIRDRDDLRRIRTPCFEAVDACRRVLAMHTLFRALTGLAPSLSVCAPFTLAASLRGIEQLLLDIVGEPAFAGELLARLTEEVVAPWIAYQQSRFPDSAAVTAVDATASPPIVSPAILRDWVAPSILRLRALCGPGVSTANWAGERFLARPRELLDLKLAVGPGWLLGQDPDVEQLGPELYAAYAAERNVPLVLGVGAGCLASARPDEVAARVRRYVEIGRRSGRFALYLCNLGASTPPENLRAAVEAAHAAPGGQAGGRPD